MIISDQPGRLLAIIVIGPSLLWTGLSLNKSVRENNKTESLRLAKIINIPLIIFSIIFILYEIFWITFAAPRKAFN